MHKMRSSPAAEEQHIDTFGAIRHWMETVLTISQLGRGEAENMSRVHEAKRET